MKRIIYTILWALTLLIIIILVKAFLFSSRQATPTQVELPPFGASPASHLSEAVSYKTVSYSNDSAIDTTAFNDYLAFIAGAYPGVTSALQKEVFNDFSLLYKWEGTNNTLKPVILMAHYDVVPPGDTTSWEKGPFSGTDDGTYIWGRGTLDDKAAMISILEAVEKLLSEGFKPERTIYLSFGHDEELGGERGASVVAKTLAERGIKAEYVLDEGMAVTNGMVPMMKVPVALIGTSEKGYITVKLTTEMPGGHSSTPEPESALILLAKAVTNLSENQMKPEISGPVNDFISYVGPEMPFHAKAIFANKWLFKGLIINIYSGSASGNALVRTTTAPTIFNAGIKDNVIPTKAEATINFRILPGQTSADVLDHVKKTIDDDRVIVEAMKDFVSEPAPVSPTDSKGFNFILTSLRQVYPSAVVAPTMMLGASDSKHFSVVTGNIYKFAPINVTSDDMARIHGLNERTRKEDFLKGIGFYYTLIRNSQSQ
ncbi:MAG: M20 family peptidase [Bacteroidales bacterium]